MPKKLLGPERDYDVIGVGWNGDSSDFFLHHFQSTIVIGGMTTGETWSAFHTVDSWDPAQASYVSTAGYENCRPTFA